MKFLKSEISLVNLNPSPMLVVETIKQLLAEIVPVGKAEIQFVNRHTVESLIDRIRKGKIATEGTYCFDEQTEFWTEYSKTKPAAFAITIDTQSKPLIAEIAGKMDTPFSESIDSLWLEEQLTPARISRVQKDISSKREFTKLDKDVALFCVRVVLADLDQLMTVGSDPVSSFNQAMVPYGLAVLMRTTMLKSFAEKFAASVAGIRINRGTIASSASRVYDVLMASIKACQPCLEQLVSLGQAYAHDWSELKLPTVPAFANYGLASFMLGQTPLKLRPDEIKSIESYLTAMLPSEGEELTGLSMFGPLGLFGLPKSVNFQSIQKEGSGYLSEGRFSFISQWASRMFDWKNISDVLSEEAGTTYVTTAQREIPFEFGRFDSVLAVSPKYTPTCLLDGDFELRDPGKSCLLLPRGNGLLENFEHLPVDRSYDLARLELIKASDIKAVTCEVKYTDGEDDKTDLPSALYIHPVVESGSFSLEWKAKDPEEKVLGAVIRERPVASTAVYKKGLTQLAGVDMSKRDDMQALCNYEIANYFVISPSLTLVKPLLKDIFRSSKTEKYCRFIERCFINWVESCTPYVKGKLAALTGTKTAGNRYKYLMLSASFFYGYLDYLGFPLTEINLHYVEKVTAHLF